MLRFGPNTKIRSRHHLRQDGTTTYFFTASELREMAARAGLLVLRWEYIHRRTINKKEGVDAPRVFLQAVMALQDR